MPLTLTKLFTQDQMITIHWLRRLKKLSNVKNEYGIKCNFLVSKLNNMMICSSTTRKSIFLNWKGSITILRGQILDPSDRNCYRKQTPDPIYLVLFQNIAHVTKETYKTETKLYIKNINNIISHLRANSDITITFPKLDRYSLTLWVYSDPSYASNTEKAFNLAI